MVQRNTRGSHHVIPRFSEILFVLFSAACLLLISRRESGIAQTSTATLTGTIEDQNGAILPNVAVTVKRHGSEY